MVLKNSSQGNIKCIQGHFLSRILWFRKAVLSAGRDAGEIHVSSSPVPTPLYFMQNLICVTKSQKLKRAVWHLHLQTQYVYQVSFLLNPLLQSVLWRKKKCDFGFKDEMLPNFIIPFSLNLLFLCCCKGKYPN